MDSRVRWGDVLPERRVRWGDVLRGGTVRWGDILRDANFGGATFTRPPIGEGASISGLLIRTDGAKEPSGLPRPFRPYVPPSTDADPAAGAGVREAPDGRMVTVIRRIRPMTRR